MNRIKTRLNKTANKAKLNRTASGNYLNVCEKFQLDAQGLRDSLWSGGKDTLNYLTDSEIDRIIGYLIDINEGEDWELSAVNDFFWFESDTIAEWLGYDDFEELMYRDDEDE